jgi:DNA-binding transcriptional ArsR family regulator
MKLTMAPQLTDPMIDDVSALFSALGGASRLKVLRALLDAREPMSQGAVAKKAGLSQANASKHLSCLVRSGLARRDSEGNNAYFSLVQPLVSRLCDLVCGHVSDRAKTSYQALR